MAPNNVTSMVGSVIALLIVPTRKIGLKKKPAINAPRTAITMLSIKFERSCSSSVATQPIIAATRRYMTIFMLFSPCSCPIVCSHSLHQQLLYRNDPSLAIRQILISLSTIFHLCCRISSYISDLLVLLSPKVTNNLRSTSALWNSQVCFFEFRFSSQDLRTGFIFVAFRLGDLHNWSSRAIKDQPDQTFNSPSNQGIDQHRDESGYFQDHPARGRCNG